MGSVSGIADLDRDNPPEAAAAYKLLRLDDAVWRHGFVAYLRHRYEARLAGAGLAAHVVAAGDIRVLRRTEKPGFLTEAARVLVHVFVSPPTRV